MKLFESKKIDNQILFGIIMSINYPLYYFLFDQYASDNNFRLILRLIAFILCILLIVKNYWPNSLKKYYHLYWQVTMFYCLGFFFGLMVMLNQLSTIALMNSMSAIFFMKILLDIKDFLIIGFLSVISSIIFYFFVLKYPLIINAGEFSSFDLIATYGAAIIIGGLFSYNRDHLSKLETILAKQHSDQLEKTVEIRTLELKDALEIKNNILGNMSHEIRTPLHGLKGIAQILIDKWDKFSEEERLKNIRDIYSNFERLTRFINNILDLSKFDAGKMNFEFEKTDLLPLIEDMILECNSLYLKDKNIKIIFDKNNIEQIEAILDPSRITQLLRNLFGNAIRYSPKGTIKAQIEHANLDNHNAIKFSLIDEGVGIPEAELGKIFEPFTQSTRTQTNSGGTGLGLPICLEIIEAHKGEIWAENNKDIGAKFSFIIPVEQIIYNENLIQNLINSDISGNSSKEKYILFIDDEEAPHQVMNLIINMYTKYKLLNAYNKDETFHFLNKYHKNISMIFVDLMMPEVSGIELISQIQNNKLFKQIPIIVQSGLIEKNPEMNNCEIVAVIQKPYDNQEIIDIINKIDDKSNS